MDQYVLAYFFKTGEGLPTKLYGTNPDVMLMQARELQSRGALKAWRIVNTASGKCYDYWKEGEVAGGPVAYRV